MNTFSKIKTFFCFLMAILLTGLISCSDNTVEPEPIDAIEGTYLMQGFQINKGLCYASSCESEVLWSDTLYRSFEISVEKIDYRQDTLLFRGLEGADVDISFNENASKTTNPDCNSSSVNEYCAYSKLTGNQLLFEIRTPFGWYDGIGILYNGTMELETTFFYRGSEVDFFLTGYKINNKL